jgi:GR25 family glycosyltransferase involved in LPS biosynthesis
MKMKNLYTEKQYRKYLEFMERIANTDDIIEGLYIHEELNTWLEENHISEQAEKQMDERMEQEFNDKVNGVTKEGKVIDFPKRE